MVSCKSIYTTVVLQLIFTASSQFLPPFPFPPLAFSPGGIPGPPAEPPSRQSMSGGMSMPMPAGLPMQGGLPMSMPFAVHQPRVPLVVMPYHSKRTQQRRIKKKKRRSSKTYYDSSDSDSDSTSNEFEFRRSSRGRRRQVLTPVVSYVTKDGYVVYQKKIQREKARDWLEIGRQKPTNLKESNEKDDVSEDDSKARFSTKRHGRD